MPPSVNSTHRAVKGRVIKSKRYRAWIDKAGKEILAQRRGQVPIIGHFQSHIILSDIMRRSNFDIDNRIKAVMDILQAHKLIQNDAMQDKLTIEWGATTLGCRVHVWPVNG